MSRFDRLEFEPLAERPGNREHKGHAAASPPAAEPQMTDRDWLKRAVADREKGLHESALRLYSRALEWDKSQVAGWVGQIQMLIALQEYPEAELWARKALELFKNNAELLAGRSQALSRIGKLSEAQATSDMSLNQQGTSGYLWLARGELILAQKQKKEAYCFDKAKQLAGNWLMLLDIAAVYEHHKLISQSLVWARQAVERAPDQAYCWYCQGKYEARLGLRRQAKISLERCVGLVPNHVDARRALDSLGKGGGVFRKWFGG